MPLDLNLTTSQIGRMAAEITARQGSREADRISALKILQTLDFDIYEERRLSISVNENRATVNFLEHPSSTFPAPSLPFDLTVAGVDGSHIDVDRHIAARCFLINIGLCVLTYGREPRAKLSNAPRLYGTDDDLVIHDEVRGRTERIEGAVLSALRHTEELRAAADLLTQIPTNHSTVILVDGPITVAGLSGRIFPDFVLRSLVTEGFAKVMDRFRLSTCDRSAAIAGYTSFPSHNEIVRALQLVRHDETEKSYRESYLQETSALDREVFALHLPPGHRSALFKSTGHPLESYQGGHSTASFYLNTGSEIARIELPSWTATDESAVGQIHSTLISQCERGFGYPRVLIEAHEQAVLTGRDRRMFISLVESALNSLGAGIRTSDKHTSKTIRRL